MFRQASGLQPFVLPWLGLEAAVAGRRDHALPARAVVQAMLAFGPELYRRGPQPIAAPVRGPRKSQPRLLVVVGGLERIRRAEALRRVAQAPDEEISRGDRRALLARDRREPALPGAARKIVVAFARERVHHGPLDPKLPAERIPQEHDRGPGMGRELASLARGVVCIEDEITRVRS